MTSNVHGNDLKKHIFSTFKTSRSQLSVYFTFGTWKQPGGAGNPAVRLIDDALEGRRMVQVRFPQFASSQFSGDFIKERVLTGSSGTNLSGFAVMVQWHLRKRRPVFLVNSTQFSGGKSSPVNFAKFPNWCCHALATMAGLATSLSVDDVLAVDKRHDNFLKMACLACLSSVLYLLQRVLFRHKFMHSWPTSQLGVLWKTSWLRRLLQLSVTLLELV